MDKLSSLISLVTRQKTFQIDLISHEEKDPRTKLSKLYNGLSQGVIKTDQDAIDLLYENTSDKENLSKLKTRLYNKLLNTIFFIDQNSSPYQEVYSIGKSCYKNYSIAKILLANRKRDLAIDLVRKTFKLTKKYEFTDLNYLLTSLLASHYSIFSIKKEKSQKYSLLRKKYLFELEAENDVEHEHGILGIALTKSSGGISIKDREEYQEKISNFVKLQKEVHTRRFNLFVYLYQSNYYLEVRNYEKVIKIVTEGIRFLEGKGIKSEDADSSLRTRGAIANFMLKKYNAAESQFIQNIEISSPRFVNWFNAYNLYFPLLIIQEKYMKAYEILTKVFNSNYFDKTHPLLIQLFKIKEAYIHFLVELGKIDPSQSKEASLRKFRLNRFLNDVPTYSKDKRGANISILIIQMILLVQNKKYGQVLDRLDTLKMYSHRYLRSDNTFRSNCFIKMLAKLPDADYHPIRWARYVKKFRDRLDEHPFELSYHNLDIEVIPFENLYDLVLEMLEKGKKF